MQPCDRTVAQFFLFGFWPILFAQNFETKILVAQKLLLECLLEIFPVVQIKIYLPFACGPVGNVCVPTLGK